MNKTKLLLLVPAVVLLAAGCGNSAPQSGNDQSTNPPATQSTNNTPSSTPSMQTSDSSSGASTWQATLMSSDNTTKGNYMITVDGHTIYLSTSRDYSSLVGKPVNISYTGSLTNFGLENITAQ